MSLAQLLLLLLPVLPLLLLPAVAHGSVSRRVMSSHQLRQFDIRIQGYTPSEDDDYVAVSVKASPGYIEKFEPFSHADRVHHMLLYGCTEPAYTGTSFWRGQATCSSGMHILYAWARNAPPLQLPDNVAFAVGNHGDPVQHLVLQIHYAKQFKGKVRDYSGVTLHMSEKVPANLAGVYLFVSGEPIPPHTPTFLNNVSCTYTSDTELHPFAFRTHTHAMGRVVSAFVKKKAGGDTTTQQWTEIGKRNPQWPQLFQQRPVPLTIQNGDFMAATCRFDSADKDDWVPMGSMGVNEMCNFYMMFYRNATSPDPFPYGAGCFNNELPELVSAEYPVEGTQLLPAHPEWEHTAHQGMQPFGVEERERITVLGGEHLGQVGGLAIGPEPEEQVVIFHRGDRSWNYGTFDQNSVLQDKTPIAMAVILVGRLDPAAGSKLALVAKYGANQFYLPHGIFVDASGAFYTTDVGSHTVAKWRVENGALKVVWSAGEQHVPGSDRRHFCKPAGIAVSRADGVVFVADGYCNSRVVKLSKDGEFLAEFGSPSSASATGGPSPSLGTFSLPHDITLNERLGEVLVADRENGRVQAFTATGGEPLYEVRHPTLFSTVYSVHFYEPIGLVFVPGMATSGGGHTQEANVFVTFNHSTHPAYSFRPATDFFQLAHVVRASHQRTIWVGEIAQGVSQGGAAGGGGAGGGGGALWRLEVIKPSEEEEEKGGLGSLLGGGGGIFAGVSVSGGGGGGQTLPFTDGFYPLLLVAFALFALCVMCILKRCLCASTSRTAGAGGDGGKKTAAGLMAGLLGGSVDRKGFKPLKTTDDDLDDLDDVLSMDGIDSEDELVAVYHHHHQQNPSSNNNNNDNSDEGRGRKTPSPKTPLIPSSPAAAAAPDKMTTLTKKTTTTPSEVAENRF